MLFVDSFDEREQLRARPVQPTQITRERGAGERLQILRPYRLTGKEALGVVLRDPRLDL
ncbi:MAG: hypothetical protein M3T56_03430 [Chloroflexota bacterium]|nr:hypothetical protein [Chloroflexota bacterium]